MSEFNMIDKDKDKDRHTKATTKTGIKQIQKQESNLRLNCAEMQDMSEFSMKDKKREKGKNKRKTTKITIAKEINLKTMSSFSFSGPSVIVNRRNEVWLELDADI